MLIVTKNPDFIFIHNPKAGGRYLCHIMMHILEPKVGIQFLHGPYPTHIKLSELEAVPHFQSFNDGFAGVTTVLCVIRNPWARMWSFYKFLVASTAARVAKRLSGESVENSIDPQIDEMVMQEMQGLAFSDWVVRSREETLASYQHVLAADQLSFVETDTSYEKIVLLKYEELGLTNHPQLNKLGINLQDIGFRHSASSDYQEHYNPEARDFVEHHFLRDIELFDYRF